MRFSLPTPHRLLAAFAVLAAGATLSLAVVLPAQLAPLDGDPFIIARAKQVTIVPGRIDVIAVRPQTAASSAAQGRRSGVQPG